MKTRKKLPQNTVAPLNFDLKVSIPNSPKRQVGQKRGSVANVFFTARSFNKINPETHLLTLTDSDSMPQLSHLLATRP